MRVITLALGALLAACFSKPPYNASGERDGGTDASDADVDAAIDAPTDAPMRTITVGNARLAAGSHHACAIAADTKLWCWGDNTDGQLGPIGVTRTGAPMQPQPTPGTGWTAIAAGSAHSCGIRAAQIHCWGNNQNGQAGGFNSINSVELPGGVAPMTLFAGHDASCATDAAGKLYCWGRVDSGAAGLTIPTQIMPGMFATPWAKIVPGSHHTCAIHNNDLAAHCWGDNTHLQLGRPPGNVALGSSMGVPGQAFIDLSVSDYATCGVTFENALMCFGSSGSGHLGPYTGVDTAAAIEVGDGFTWTAIALGLDHACGIANGKVRCYGVNGVGAMGNGFDGHRAPAMVTLPGNVDAAEVVSGHEFSCARGVNGTVACWGVNRAGELGNGEIASSRASVAVNLNLAVDQVVTQIAVGDGHSCALIQPMTGASIVKCWGDNRSQQVDTGVTFAEVPRQSMTDVSSIAAGGVHTCGVKTDGSAVRCWGNNQSAQLGRTGSNGVNDVDDPPIGPWTKVAAGSTATCAIAGTELHCWGDTPGPVQGSSNPPTRVSNLSHLWSRIVLGSGFGVGVVDSIEIGGFGRRCPLGETTDPSAAAPATLANNPPTPFELAAAQTAGNHVCMHEAAGSSGTPTIRCWGDNSRHQIEPTDTGSACNPVTMALSPPLAKWIVPAPGSLSVAGGHSCAIADVAVTGAPDPRLYCWGADDRRVLGIGTSNPGTPVRINELLVSKVATGASHTCVIGRLSGVPEESVHCWGENRYGEIGNGYRFRDTPVAVTLP